MPPTGRRGRPLLATTHSPRGIGAIPRAVERHSARMGVLSGSGQAVLSPWLEAVA